MPIKQTANEKIIVNPALNDVFHRQNKRALAQTETVYSIADL